VFNAFHHANYGMPEDWGGGETVQVDAAFKSFIFEGAPAELEDPNLRFREVYTIPRSNV
jgi:hypothetical protein